MANQEIQLSDPDQANNNPTSRYLFDLGKTKAKKHEYTDAKDSFLQAAAKAPSFALGFRVQCFKWAIIVRLLLGEIPELTVFLQKGMDRVLEPYYDLTTAVRFADVQTFKKVSEKFATTFSSDGTSNLIVRLHGKVVRAALRKISNAKPKISNADAAKQGRLDSKDPVADAESSGADAN